jgi:hypothetical protein
VKLNAIARAKIQLLFEPYQSPSLKRGDRAFCLYRGRVVVITGWSEALISWPRCRSLESRGGGRGLLMDDELARAVRHESAAALQHWWGVSRSVVRHWRKALNVGRMDAEGSRRLILGVVRGCLRARGQERPRASHPGHIDDLLWTPEEMALVGVLCDAEVAARTGRTPNAVQIKRKQLGRPNPNPSHRRWTAREDELVLTLPIAEAAARMGRTLNAVHARRRTLRGR